MKKMISFLISFCLAAVFLIPRLVELPIHQTMLQGSALPLLAALLDLNNARPSWEEIKDQKFRLTVYGLSLGVFLLCLLSAVGVIPLTRVDQGITQFKKAVMTGLVYVIFGLTVINLFMDVRDINRRDKGLPL